MKLFLEVLDERWIDPENKDISELTEDAIGWFAAYLKTYTPATERLYLQAVKGFYEYLAADNSIQINLPRLKLLLKQRSRRSGIRLPQFPREEIETIINFVETHLDAAKKEPMQQLRALRDRAFIITLADTGLRVSEACGLRRGDIDWFEGKAIIIGKGDKQAIIRFSKRAIDAISKYLKVRMVLDGKAGIPLQSLPIFARHDKGAGKKVKPITTTTGRNIVSNISKLALGQDYEKAITPHSFRHYFVTTVLNATGNLKIAQELARHTNISVTQRYAHLSDSELDKNYIEIFDQDS
ncbi:tyrosine-type recombinase/integrase [Chloroflexota bacterium]